MLEGKFFDRLEALPEIKKPAEFAGFLLKT